MFRVRLSRHYKTALKRIARHKDFNRETLEEVVRSLARGEPLEQKYQDHQLTGEMKDSRECHIKHNLLLVYEKHDDVLVLLLINLGTHDEVLY